MGNYLGEEFKDSKKESLNSQKKVIKYSEYLYDTLKYSNSMSKKPILSDYLKNTTPSLKNINWQKNASSSGSSSLEESEKKNFSNDSNCIKIMGISFDEDLMKFLNWDELDIFIKNIETLEAVGRGSDKSTIIKFQNEKNEKILVSIKNNHFYKYEGRVDPFYAEIDDCEKKISELSIIINEKEIELQKLDIAEIIEIDNNTLDLISEYTEKIKNYFDDNLSDTISLDLEKSNMKTLMEADILKI